MQKDTLTLVLTGKVTLGDFARAFDGFNKLISALHDEKAHGVEIEWVVDNLESGSAIATIRGQPLKNASINAVEDVVKEYEAIGKRMQAGNYSGLSPKVRDSIKSITSVIDGRVESVRLETNEVDVEILEPIPNTEIDEVHKIRKAQTSIGAIRGRIESLNRRGGLRFTLYDSIANHAVSCYLQDGTASEEMMRSAWGKMAVVEGIVRRNAITGLPITIRSVTAVRLINENDKWAWRAAVGAAPSAKGQISASQAIRRGRDD